MVSLPGVVPLGLLTGSIFLACNELLGVEELAVGASVNFISDRGFSEMCLSAPGSLRKLTMRHLLLQGSCHLASDPRAGCCVPGVALPAGVTHLDTSLVPMDRDVLTRGSCFGAAGLMVVPDVPGLECSAGHLGPGSNWQDRM